MSTKFDAIKRRAKRVMLKSLPGMITCREFENFIVDYLEGALPETQIKLFERHIKICRECKDYLAAYQLTTKLSAALKVAPDEPVPSDVPQDLIDAVANSVVSSFNLPGQAKKGSSK